MDATYSSDIFFMFSVTWSVQLVLGFLSIHLSSLAFEDLRGTLLLSLLKLCLLLMHPSLCDVLFCCFLRPYLTYNPQFYCFFFFPLIHSFISIQPWRPGLAGTRAQSCGRYGSGTLHLGQVLGGRLPLLSPAFRHSHFSRQPREILAAKGGTVGEKDVR